MKKMKNWRTMVGGLAVVAAATVLLPGCGNRKPVISELTTAAQVEAGKSAVVTCTAADPDGDSLSYEWTCSRGSLAPDTGSVVHWNAPMASGRDTVTVAVSDGRRGEATKSVAITVLPTSYNIIVGYGTLYAGEYDSWWAVLDAGTRMHGTFFVESLDVNFLVMNELNFPKWQNGQNYVPLLEFDRTPGDSFYDTIQAAGKYYFVLDNMYSTVDKQAHVYVEGTTP